MSVRTDPARRRLASTYGENEWRTVSISLCFPTADTIELVACPSPIILFLSWPTVLSNPELTWTLPPLSCFCQVFFLSNKMQSPRWKGSYLNTGVITRMEGYSPGWRVSQLDGGVINSKEKGNQVKQSGLLSDSTNSLFPPRGTFFAFYHDAIWKLAYPSFRHDSRRYTRESKLAQTVY